MNFDFLYKYVIEFQEVEKHEIMKVGRSKHLFWSVPELYIQKATAVFNPFPKELQEFYETIGFGFMNRGKNIGNCIIDPISLIYVNKQEGYLATQKVQEFAKYYDLNQTLMFCHTYEEQYFAISCEAINGRNAIWYKETKVEASLRDFLYYSLDADYLSMHIFRDEIEVDREKKKKEKAERKIIEEKNNKIRYIGGHELVDRYP